MINPVWREQVLHQAIEALKQDQRIMGVLLIGSGVDGFLDELSDIDLLAVTATDEDVALVHADWEPTVRRLVPVLHHARTPFTETNHLHVFILDDLLELDTSFAALSSLQRRWDQGRIIFDRTGAVTRRLKDAERAVPRPQDHRSLFDQACHRVMECRKALHRKKRWQASLTLDELRALTLQMAGLVSLGSTRQRDVDRLPPALLDELSWTVVPVEEDQLREALRLLTIVMLDQAEQLHARAGAGFPDRFASALLASFDTEKTPPL